MQVKLTRSSSNPILLPTNNTWENRYVYNPAVFELNGQIHLLYRAQGTDMVSRLGLARLGKPDEVLERSNDPIFAPDPASEYEVLGVEDPRVTKIGDKYYILYTAASHYPEIIELDEAHKQPENWRVRVSLAYTHDFQSFTRFGVVIGHIDSKDAALFPELINENYLMVHRVIPHARLAIAPDARNYKERGPLFWPRPGMWDSKRIGMGAPPIKTPHGWLLFYHGVDDNMVYRLGLALLDVHNPAIVLGRSSEPILEPEEVYEKEGLVPNIVFTCGAVETSSEYLVYYGAGDAVVGLATVSKDIILKWTKHIYDSCSSFHTFEQYGRDEKLFTS
ncbi:MAG: glycosidase [bacterium]|nr:glycosidase [bacterium]